ncbi:MAG: 3-phosphoshikimate 1-carboxyvinyltransferase [Actinomycetota bacterium]
MEPVKSDLWRAPSAPSHPLDVTLEIPGSKSMMARALILSALASNPTLIKRPLVSRDSELMRDGLRALGVKIEESAEGWRITPAKLTGESAVDGTRVTRIDVGNAGTVMRFLPSLAAMSEGHFHFDGDDRSHERPIGPLIRALEELGVKIEHDGRYCLPLTIHGAGQLRGGEIEIDASLSSQFVSSLLLVAPFMRDGLTIKDVGASLPSLPHIEMTLAMLEDHGYEVETSYPDEEVRWWRVYPETATETTSEETPPDRTIEIEPDLSNAAPFLAAALLIGGNVTIKSWPRETSQPGDALREILALMGGRFIWRGENLAFEATGKRSDIKGIDIDLSNEGELTPTIAAIAAFASSPSRLRGIGHLRLHETDRLRALAVELRKVGAEIEEGDDFLEITPARDLPKGPITIESYDDHRIATLGALVGLMIDETRVENIATTRKTITDFPAMWAHLLGDSK